MYCKTKSNFTSCTDDVTYLDIRSPIYDYSDFEEEFLPQGDEDVEESSPDPKPKKNKKHNRKHKRKHKRRRRERKCSEKRDEEQDEEQETETAEAQNEQGIWDAELRSITRRQPVIPAETNNDSSTRYVLFNIESLRFSIFFPSGVPLAGIGEDRCPPAIP